MANLGYDKEILSIDYASGSPAALGNYIAQTFIEFGLQDGSNPFNPQTNIRYTVSQQTTVTLEVYSATGRLVRQLVQRQ